MLSSRKVDAVNVINWQSSIRRSTARVYHANHQAVSTALFRRAGQLATADICRPMYYVRAHRAPTFAAYNLLRGPCFSFYGARCYASAVLAMGLCPCPSVCHKSVFYRNGETNLAGFWYVSFLQPVLHCVKRKFGYLQK